MAKRSTASLWGQGPRDSHKNYPHHLRHIRFKDSDTHQTLIFLANLFNPPPKTIWEPYKAHWQVELHFNPAQSQQSARSSKQDSIMRIAATTLAFMQYRALC